MAGRHGKYGDFYGGNYRRRHTELADGEETPDANHAVPKSLRFNKGIFQKRWPHFLLRSSQEGCE